MIDGGYSANAVFENILIALEYSMTIEQGV
jgi:hypothetical protein